MEQKFTDLRSLIRGFAHAMNLVAPDVQNHHEKVAYLSYRIAEEAGLGVEQCQMTMYAGLVHDVGVVLMGEGATLEDVERQPVASARMGASVLGLSAITKKLAGAIDYSELAKHAPKPKPGSLFNPLVTSQIAYVSDWVSLELNEETPVLNQVESLKRKMHETASCLALADVVKAFERVCEKEYVWMDLLYRPGRFIEFVPAEKLITLDQAIEYTKFMSMLIDFRSPFTAMHSAGVAASAESLARLAGMSENECKMMRIAGYLHDVGKLKIPKAILEKPGKLTDEEFNVIKEHPYYTYTLLSDIEGFEQICLWASLHHEKLNGKGYPFGLKESQIPLGARIMAVADVFSAITEERPYRKGMPKDKVISILRENAERGELTKPIVELLVARFNEVNAARDAEAHEAGARYFSSLEEGDEQANGKAGLLQQGKKALKDKLPSPLVP